MNWQHKRAGLTQSAFGALAGAGKEAKWFAACALKRCVQNGIF
jgi:hypothetical protein